MVEHRPIINIVDDDDSVRVAVSRLLEFAGYQVCGYSNAGDFLMKGDLESHGCLILDVRMPGPGGMELQDSLNKNHCHLPIIFMTGHGDIPLCVRALKAGAVDFLTKPVSREVLLEVVREALALDLQNRLARQETSLRREQYLSLSGREKAILRRVVEGAPNKVIAAELSLSERTVKSHRAQIMEKFSIHSLIDLVRIADDLKRSGIPLV